MSQPSAPATLQFVPLMGRRGGFSVTSIYLWKSGFTLSRWNFQCPRNIKLSLRTSVGSFCRGGPLKPSSSNQIHRSGSSGNSSCRRRPDSPPIPCNSLHRRGERHSPKCVPCIRACSSKFCRRRISPSKTPDFRQ